MGRSGDGGGEERPHGRTHWRQRRGLSPIWCLPVMRTGPEPDLRRKVTGGWSWKSSKLSWKKDKDEGLAHPIS